MKAKKYTELYNDVWQALHKRDKFVVTSDKTHDELVDYLAKHLERFAATGSTVGGFHIVSWPELAEEVLLLLACQDDA